uniref:Peptidase M12B domain-containing protein n=1 Tax=Erpetoichthys calabaricus TaxID=27687 RepID=A0A8C4TST3_ERPCA
MAWCSVMLDCLLLVNQLFLLGWQKLGPILLGGWCGVGGTCLLPPEMAPMAALLVVSLPVATRPPPVLSLRQQCDGGHHTSPVVQVSGSLLVFVFAVSFHQQTQRLFDFLTGCPFGLHFHPSIHYPTRCILTTGSRGSAGANPSQHIMQGRKQTPGRAPAHHKACISIKRYSCICLDLCGHHSCDTLGMADVGTICSPERSCAVIEDDGLHAAFTVAHEIGHLLGLSHDDSKYCEENFGSMEDKRLMSSILTSIDASKPWSKCTSSTITDFFDDGHGECLLDPPRRHLLGPEELPGQSYDAIRQCKLAFGPEYTVCPGMDVCARLWCAVIRQGQMVCLTKKLPAVEGTPCGKGRICLHGKCSLSLFVPQITNHGSWSSWGPWGQCSLTCGGGVQFAHRLCNNPPPRNNGRFCTGKRSIYRSCNVEACPASSNLQNEQCEARNGFQTDPKGVKTFVEWVPKYAGVLPGDVCKLTCRAKGTGYYVVFSPRVTDGTECRPYSNSVCVRGKCVRTGCDGIIGSKLMFDKCGICGGDNSGCSKVVGNFTKKSKGYTDVVKIPEGATHIKVRQYKAKDQQRYTAYLALRKQSGDYLLNGKFMISTSETIIDLNGTVMNYSGWSQRDDFLHTMGPGALREGLTVQILATDARHPLDVRYSFFVPQKPAAPPGKGPKGNAALLPALPWGGFGAHTILRPVVRTPGDRPP